MPSRLSPRRAAGLVVRPLRRALAERAAIRGARRYARACRADVIVCWDLDNTLVDSGTLLRQGMSLADSVVAAEPVPSMLGFFAAVSEALPGAEHVILSARPSALRSATMDWLSRHCVQVTADRVWLVPNASAKPAVWRCLARRTSLVIVDDLSYGHEGDVRLLYDDLVEAASSLATVYVGLSDVVDIGASAERRERLAAGLVECLSGVAHEDVPPIGQMSVGVGGA